MVRTLISAHTDMRNSRFMETSVLLRDSICVFCVCQSKAENNGTGGFGGSLSYADAQGPLISPAKYRQQDIWRRATVVDSEEAPKQVPFIARIEVPDP